MPHALLLSGSLGQGHDVMAAACADSLHDRGWTTSTVDAMALLGRRSGAAGKAVFRRLLAIAGRLRRLPLLGAAPGQPPGAPYREGRGGAARTPDQANCWRREPADLVVSVFATAAVRGRRGCGARAGQVPPHMVFCTDVTPHRLWVHPRARTSSW